MDRNRDRNEFHSFRKGLPRAALSRLYAADMHYIKTLPADAKDLEAINAFIEILSATATRMKKELEGKAEAPKAVIEINRTVYLTDNNKD